MNKKGFAILLIALSFLALILALYPPIKNTFEYNQDEGIESMKAVLYLKGFPLYHSIWSDQPPLFTLILAFWFKILGISMYNARLLILGFSIILLLFFYLTLETRENKTTAFLACLFLTASYMFMPLSISVILGIPNLAFAISAVYFLIIYKKNGSKALLLISAFFLSLSILIKFLTALLIPVFILELILNKPASVRQNNKKFTDIFIWLAALLSICLITLLIFIWPNLPIIWDQLLKPHITATRLTHSGFNALVYCFKKDLDILALSFLGAAFCFKKTNKDIFALSWAGIITLFFIFYRPIWSHYYILLSLPLCWISAKGAANFIIPIFTKANGGFNKIIRLTGILITSLAIILTPLKIIRAFNMSWGQTTDEHSKIVGLLQQYNSLWVITDLPTYAFYANKLVPPEIAVATIKRRFIKDSEQNYFINTIKKYNPEIIALGEFTDYPAKIMDYIAHYFPASKKISFFEWQKNDYLFLNNNFAWESKIFGGFIEIPLVKIIHCANPEQYPYKKKDIEIFIRRQEKI